jgi:hypothetical protein
VGGAAHEPLQVLHHGMHVGRHGAVQEVQRPRRVWVGVHLVIAAPIGAEDALGGRIQPTPVTVPAYGVHAIPYYWLHRGTVDDVLRDFDVPAFQHDLEGAVDEVLKFKPEWVLHGDNQKALIERFFADVDACGSLVFFYAKHSPFDSERSGGPLLVGAARITDVQLPGQWRTNGTAPFPSHMWETTVLHSLR